MKLRPIQRIYRPLTVKEIETVRCCLNFDYALFKLQEQSDFLNAFVLAKLIEDILSVYIKAVNSIPQYLKSSAYFTMQLMLRRILDEGLISEREITQSRIMDDVKIFLREFEKNLNLLREHRAQWLVREYIYLKGWL